MTYYPVRALNRFLRIKKKSQSITSFHTPFIFFQTEL